MAKEISEYVDELRDVVMRYSAFGGVPLPNTVRQALKEEWELEIPGFTFLVETKYAKEDQKRDRQVLIRFESFVEIYQDLSRVVRAKEIELPGAPLVGVWHGISSFGEQIIGTIEFLVSALLILASNYISDPAAGAKVLRDSVIELITRILSLYFELFLRDVGILKYFEKCYNVIRLRDDAISRLRLGALASGTKKRVHRRKRSRSRI